MNTEIKFRAWNKNKKRLMDWQELLNNWHMVKNALTLVRSEKNSDGGIFSNQAYSEAWEITLMQFVGLKDKNNKDAYIGDIVKSNNGRVYVIKMHDQYLEFFFEAIEDAHALTPLGMLLKGGYFFIIGNIYENENLLK